METVTVDDLPVGCAPWPRLQLVHDPTAFGETGKPLAECRGSGRTEECQHQAFGPERRLASGNVGAKKRDGSAREVAVGNGISRTVGPVELRERVQLNCTAKDVTVERQGLASGAGKMKIGRRVSHGMKCNAPFGRATGFHRGPAPPAQCLARYALRVNAAIILGRSQTWTRRLLRCGVAAGPVFVVVFLIEGAVRDGYRPLRHPVSSLALGPRGWIQAGNFAVAGTLFLAGAAGLARAGDLAASGRAAPALIGAAGAGLMGSAVFTTDPVSGYPPGTPDALTQPSRAGTVHNLAAVPVFAGLPAAALASGWRSWRAGQHRFGLYSAGTAVTMLTTVALAGAGFGQSPRLVSLGGLFQRASIITGFAWLTALSARALRRTRR